MRSLLCKNGVDKLILGIALWQQHAILMTVSLLFFCVAIISIYLKNKKWWYTAHKLLGSVGFLFALAGMFIAFYMIHEVGGRHFRVFHAQLGLFSIIILALVLGLTPFRRHRLVRKLHIILGFIGTVLVIGTILYGLLLVGII